MDKRIYIKEFFLTIENKQRPRKDGNTPGAREGYQLFIFMFLYDDQVFKNWLNIEIYLKDPV